MMILELKRDDFTDIVKQKKKYISVFCNGVIIFTSEIPHSVEGHIL